MNTLTWNQFQSAAKAMGKPLKNGYNRTTEELIAEQYISRSELYTNETAGQTPIQFMAAAYKLYIAEKNRE